MKANSVQEPKFLQPLCQGDTLDHGGGDGNHDSHQDIYDPECQVEEE
jgi:hypothetical protein